jgi:FAD:protein FMN transferase
MSISRRCVFCLVIAAALSSACENSTDRQRRLYAFGTIVTLRTYGASDQQLDDATTALEQRYRIIDLDWYPWIKQDSLRTGELFDLNEAIARGQAVTVDPQLATLIRRATEIEQLSGGLFSPATAGLSRLWGFDNVTEPPASLPHPEEIQALLNAGINTRPLHWNGDTLESSSNAIALDLGGIAKGAVLALSVEILFGHGIQNAIIDIGGDLSVVGTVNGRAARIGIRSPAGAGAVGWLEVRDGETVVTSGDYERYFEIDGQRYSHILDPRTGYPVAHTAAVTVVHTDPLLADAAATALVVGGLVEFDDICRKLGINTALLIDSSGDLRLTPAMQKRVKWTK